MVLAWNDTTLLCISFRVMNFQLLHRNVEEGLRALEYELRMFVTTSSKVMLL